MFDAIENSRWLGQPVQLFIFRRQGLTWRFASGDRNVVVGEHTYLGAKISRDEIRQTAERAKDKLKITIAYLCDPAAEEVPVTQPLGDVWRPFIPSDPVTVICLATHYGDTEPPIVEWMGEVTGPAYTDTECELTCEPSTGGAARNQGAKWQRGCWKTVFSTGPRGCNLDPETVKVEGALSEMIALTLTSSAFAASPFNLRGGTFYWTRDDGVVEERPIMAHSGSTIQVLWGGIDLDVDRDFVALPGCPGNWGACDAFGNTDNYGGAIYKAVKNPHDGVSMSWG